jgi:hypothetical protein
MESPKSAILGFRTGNLGDDLQSVAAALSLPFVDCMVERDRLADARLATPHVCIMNSWFTRQWLRPPSRFIQPLFHGLCFGRREMRYGLWRRYLRRHGSIGCRDTGSVAQLAAMGVAGHWTGCLTLHLGRWLAPVPAEERSGVLLVDLDPAVETYLPKRIRERSRRLTNFVPDEIVDDPLARMSRIARICDELRRAELVVTRRLHTALPCVGFSTPTVVYLSNTRANRHRFSGYETMFPFHLHGDKRCRARDHPARAR